MLPSSPTILAALGLVVDDRIGGQLGGWETEERLDERMNQPANANENNNNNSPTSKSRSFNSSTNPLSNVRWRGSVCISIGGSGSSVS